MSHDIEPIDKHSSRDEALEEIAGLVRRWVKFMPVMAAANLMIGLPAFIVSGVVAYATFEQADATRKIQEASAWPRLQFGRGFDFAPDPPLAVLKLENDGIGPAIVKGMRVRLDGEPVNDWAELGVRANGGAWEGSMSSTTVDDVVKAGETIELARFAGFDMRSAVIAALRADRIEAEICYCSIFGSCWRHMVPTETTEKIDQCPDYGAAQFGVRPSNYAEPEREDGMESKPN